MSINYLFFTWQESIGFLLPYRSSECHHNCGSHQFQNTIKGKLVYRLPREDLPVLQEDYDKQGIIHLCLISISSDSTVWNPGGSESWQHWNLPTSAICWVVEFPTQNHRKRGVECACEQDFCGQTSVGWTASGGYGVTGEVQRVWDEEMSRGVDWDPCHDKAWLRHQFRWTSHSEKAKHLSGDSLGGIQRWGKKWSNPDKFKWYRLKEALTCTSDDITYSCRYQGHSQ